VHISQGRPRACLPKRPALHNQSDCQSPTAAARRCHVRHSHNFGLMLLLLLVLRLIFFSPSNICTSLLANLITYTSQLAKFFVVWTSGEPHFFPRFTQLFLSSPRSNTYIDQIKAHLQQSASAAVNTASKTEAFPLIRTAMYRIEFVDKGSLCSLRASWLFLSCAVRRVDWRLLPFTNSLQSKPRRDASDAVKGHGVLCLSWPRTLKCCLHLLGFQ
jgi:hypothetical protein